MATHAINRGVPAVLSHQRGVLGKSYRQFARKLIKELPLGAAGRRQSEDAQLEVGGSLSGGQVAEGQLEPADRNG